MLITPKTHLYLDVKDEAGQAIPFVVGADKEAGFLVILTDVADGVAKSLKTTRKYCTFTL